VTTAASGVVLEAIDLAVGYGAATVVEGVDLTLRASECLAIIGPNGTGKSTLLRGLAGVLTAARGEVRILGRDIRRYRRRELARAIAGVPAELAPAFSFRVRDLVGMGRHPYVGLLGELTEDDRRAVAAAMAATETTALAERWFDELSSGERQRVVLAQALAQEAPLLLLDEPTAHLDLNHATHLLDLLQELRSARGLAVVLVSHDLNLAAEYADRLLLLAGGRPRAHGAPSEVLDYRVIEEVYQTVVVVETNRVSGRPRVVPVSRWSLDRASVDESRDG